MTATKLKIFKQDEEMIAEQTALMLVVNMGLNMAKEYASQALNIPEIGYPSLKRCLGLRFVEPEITLEEGFIMLATDIGVRPGSLDCSEDTYPGEYATIDHEAPRSGFYQEAMASDEIEEHMRG